MKPRIAIIALLVLCSAQACLAAQMVEPDRLVACARAMLEARSVDLPGELELVAGDGMSASRVAGDGQVRIEAGDVAGAWPRRRIGVPVQVWMDDRLVQTRMVWFDVRWWRDVRVYTHDARVGERADTVATRMARTDVAGLGGGLATEPLEMRAGLRLRRAVRAGQPVLATHFQSAPAVNRHDRVALTLREGPIALRTTAVAQGDGEVGQRIRVLPEGGDRWVLAKVVARDEVTFEN